MPNEPRNMPASIVTRRVPATRRKRVLSAVPAVAFSLTFAFMLGLSEGTARAYTWYSDPSNTSYVWDNTLVAGGTFPINGAVQIPLAPTYVAGTTQNLNFLTNTTGTWTADFGPIHDTVGTQQIKYYNGSTFQTVDYYFQGLWVDASGSSIWGWGSVTNGGGGVWTGGVLAGANSVSDSFTPTAAGITSFASDTGTSTNANTWYATYADVPVGSCGGTEPSGFPGDVCTGGTPTSPCNLTHAGQTWGGMQVTVDRQSLCEKIGQFYGELYVLDQCQVVWQRLFNCQGNYCVGGCPQWGNLSMKACNGTTVSPVQIAAKNEYVYALQPDSANGNNAGTVWWSYAGGCWTQFSRDGNDGGDHYFLSIATDNVTASEYGVWATGGGGVIWYTAQP